MLLAIPVEGFDPNYIYSLGNCLVVWVANLLDPLLALVPPRKSRRDPEVSDATVLDNRPR